MRKNRELMMILIAAAAGFFGGLLAAHLPATQTAAAADKPAARAAAAMEEVLSGPGVISAQKFVLLSPDKHPRGLLGTDKKGMPVLELYEAECVRRAMLAVRS